MAALTVHLLTHNNESTISKAIESLRVLQPKEIAVIDDKSTDRTVEIATSLGAKIIIMPPEMPRSEVRNSFVKSSRTDWHFYIEPFETLGSGHQAIIKSIEGTPQNYRVLVSHEDLLTKSTRLWHRSTNSFAGMVFESLDNTNSKSLNTILYSQIQDHTEYQLRLIDRWQKTSPADADPYYYEAMIHLAKFRYDDFIRAAEHFLFHSTTMTMPVVMTRYYLALTHALVKKDAHQAFANLVVCLSLKPRMAEFWCLLGDIHYFVQHNFDKAHWFYQTALIMGKKRKTGDEWPVQLSKYKDYPNRMLDSCKAIMDHQRT